MTTLKLSFCIESPPLLALITCEIAKKSGYPILLISSSETTLHSQHGIKLCGNFAIARYIARLNPKLNLYGQDALESTLVEYWLDFSTSLCKVDYEESLHQLDAHIFNKSFMIGFCLTIADIAIFVELKTKYNSDKIQSYSNIEKWMAKLEDLSAFSIYSDYFTANSVAKKEKRVDIGKYVKLPGAEEGQVVVRFPPEASGYLHIGHAKAALLNQHYQQVFKGKLIMRFDDTNPDKESSQFEAAILKDLRLIGVIADKYSHTSDYFDEIMDYAEKLIKLNAAYVDDTEPDIQKKERLELKNSRNRDSSLHQNLFWWSEMKNGTDFGKKCSLRAKIDMQSKNGALRDPTIFRCKDELHIRTGSKYKAYPTYDFACPIVDSLEAVTHALRTTEYHDRDKQYYWFIEKLELARISPSSEKIYFPCLYEYSRLALQNTILSKRKLSWFVEEGIVEGWDDPRMPTVRGMLRRGLTVEGLKQFIVAQGSSKSNAHMQWDKLWAFNRRVLDPIVPRHTAIIRNNIITVMIKFTTNNSKLVPMHNKNLSLGMKYVYYSDKIYIERVDAEQLSIGDPVVLINWGVAHVSDINMIANRISMRLDLKNTDYKDKPNLTWLANIECSSCIPTVLITYDNLITKSVLDPDDDFKKFVNYNTKSEVEALGDPYLNKLKFGDIIQLQRKGFYICDQPYELDIHTSRWNSCVLISIPSGHTKDLHIIENTSTNIGNIEKQPTDARYIYGQNLANNQLEISIKDQNVSICEKYTETDSHISGTNPDPKNAYISIKMNEETKKLLDEVHNCGRIVRDLKDKKANQEEIKLAVSDLLNAKAVFKSLTGNDPPPLPHTKYSKANIEENLTKIQQKKNRSSIITSEKRTTINTTSIDTRIAKKVTRDRIEMSKLDNFSEWYIEVIQKAEMIEYYDVSGCYILRPWAYGIWEIIQKFLDTGIKNLGVENCYFPMFVSKNALETEKAHIEDFAPEVAWVTRSGNSELDMPIAIRPTSETAMYPAYAKWIRSHRDLPLKLNQWNSVVRWEFKNPQPFLRTREFLWQEGHSAFETKDEAVKEVHDILELYRRVYEDILAIHVICGRKTEKEKFAGGDYTTTTEAYIFGSGRGIQGATSHHLGQNFSKMFDIGFQDPVDPDLRKHVYQNCWGLSTRTIGVLVMVHGDDKGLVLPPNVAKIQVIVIPCGISSVLEPEFESELLKYCENFVKLLQSAGIHAKGDFRDNYSPGWKYHHWELKGVPLRVEIGPREVKQSSFVGVSRIFCNKETYKLNHAVNDVNKMLSSIQEFLFKRSVNETRQNIKLIKNWSEFVPFLENKNLILIPFCGKPLCEDKIKADSASTVNLQPGTSSMGAKSLCIPFDQPESVSGLKCLHPECTCDAQFYALFGRSY